MVLLPCLLFLSLPPTTTGTGIGNGPSTDSRSKKQRDGPTKQNTGVSKYSSTTTTYVNIDPFSRRLLTWTTYTNHNKEEKESTSDPGSQGGPSTGSVVILLAGDACSYYYYWSRVGEDTMPDA